MIFRGGKTLLKQVSSLPEPLPLQKLLCSLQIFCFAKTQKRYSKICKRQKSGKEKMLKIRF